MSSGGMIMNTLKAFGGLLVETYKEWKEDNASRMAAALSYYTIFSLAPIVFIVITILGWIYREGDVSGLFMSQVTGLIGESGGAVFEAIIAAAQQPQASTWATIISVVTALFGATGVFVELKASLNAAWGITEERFSGLKGMVLVRAISLTVTLVIGFLLLVSLFISTALSAVTSRLNSDHALISVGLQILNQVIAIAMIAALFAFIFKFLPDIKIPWKDVWVGAIFTSILFNIGKFLIGLYLGNSDVGSAFGAAGSLLILLLWVYYSAQLILFGAEFTQVYSDRYGSKALTGTPKSMKHKAMVPEDEAHK